MNLVSQGEFGCMWGMCNDSSMGSISSHCTRGRLHLASGSVLTLITLHVSLRSMLNHPVVYSPLVLQQSPPTQTMDFSTLLPPSSLSHAPQDFSR